MISIAIPGYGNYEIKNLVLDYNGTIAEDGRLISGIGVLLHELSELVEIYVITADTFGTVENELREFPIRIHKISSDNEQADKFVLLKAIGPESTVSIGNGNNDAMMLRESAIGICVLGSEGCSKKAMDSSDILIKDVRHALELLMKTNRLKATLRY